ncbi:hypothetical protein RintRC_4180 [Richelia intracellularis]|nr:hypothetical protein RintRC_4180 [Richelia intracellularis]
MIVKCERQRPLGGTGGASPNKIDAGERFARFGGAWWGYECLLGLLKVLMPLLGTPLPYPIFPSCWNSREAQTWKFK